MPVPIGDLFRETVNRIRPVSGDLAQREAELILQHVLDITRSALYTKDALSVNNDQYKLIEKITNQRLTGRPLAHLLGSAYFYQKTFTITEDVLIPRPDTEILIEEVLHNESDTHLHFLDLGTGSGIIAESLCQTMPKWKAVASDISERSLKVAKKNCCRSIMLLCCDKMLAFREHDIFDFIVTNPPYISGREMNTIEASVKEYEPPLALYGGDDGLDFYRYLSVHSKKVLKRKGRIYCEIGCSQGNVCADIFEKAAWKNISISPDLACRSRVIKACL